MTFRPEIVATHGTWCLVATKSALSLYQVQELELTDAPSVLAELMVRSGRTDRIKFREQVVTPLLTSDQLKMTILDKPKSSQQQYRTTDDGRSALVTARWKCSTRRCQCHARLRLPSLVRSSAAEYLTRGGVEELYADENV